MVIAVTPRVLMPRRSRMPINKFAATMSMNESVSNFSLFFFPFFSCPNVSRVKRVMRNYGAIARYSRR